MEKTIIISSLEIEQLQQQIDKIEDEKKRQELQQKLDRMKKGATLIASVDPCNSQVKN